MSELDNLVSEGYAVEVRNGDYWILSSPEGRNVLYDPASDYLLPFVERLESYQEEEDGSN